MRTGRMFHRDAQTFLVHLFGRGLDDERYVIEKYRSHPNGEIEPIQAEDTVRAYKRLSRIERAFRSGKTVDLMVRPIHHWRPERVCAHILLCMLAYRSAGAGFSDLMVLGAAERAAALPLYTFDRKAARLEAVELLR